ncbi:MAG TPA: hypothetical protein VMB48_02545 [Steroidobacteraceae bacterium]|nr:hypothetical protein [Steroidobacteraceae bacterium]
MSPVAAAVALVLGVAGVPLAMAQTSPEQNSPSNAPPASSSSPAIQAGPVTLTFGGFTELATIYRNKDETADVGSSFNAIPMGSNQQSYISEFRESARQSRLSLLAQGEPYDGAKAEAYFEMDFLGAAPTANSNESNSYNLRMRNIYGKFESDSGWYILGGQSWSLVTLEKKGMEPRDENVPLTIDAQYVAGFNWTRNPQVRLVDKVTDGLWLGLSLESPQATGITTTNNVPTTAGTPSAFPTDTITQVGNTSGSLYAPTTNYSIDPAPDVVAKIAADPGYGHYELYGLGRWFRSAVGTDTNTSFGGGVGAGMILPLAPQLLSFQLSGLVGKGIARYGSGSMADVVMKPDGALEPVAEYEVLAGFTATPSSAWQLYLYSGREQESRTLYQGILTNAAGTDFGPYYYGLGLPGANNSGCYTLGGTCAGANRKIDQVTGGFWWKAYRGQLGNVQVGMQMEWLERTLFAGTGGLAPGAPGLAPDANIFIGMFSFRYYPYQH